MGLRVISFKIDNELLNMLDRYCEKYRLKRSEVIRVALIKLLSERDLL